MAVGSVHTGSDGVTEQSGRTTSLPTHSWLEIRHQAGSSSLSFVELQCVRDDEASPWCMCVKGRCAYFPFVKHAIWIPSAYLPATDSAGTSLLYEASWSAPHRSCTSANH